MNVGRALRDQLQPPHPLAVCKHCRQAFRDHNGTQCPGLGSRFEQAQVGDPGFEETRPGSTDDYLARSRRLLTKAESQGHPEHKIGDAIVGIGWAIVHWLSTQEEGREHGNPD